MTVKEAPARGLRAVIARFRGKGGKTSAVATKAEAPVAAAPESGNVKVVTPETVVAEAKPETVVAETAPETVVAEAQPETAAPETVVAEAAPETVVAEAAPETVVAEAQPETVVAETAAAEPATPETVVAETEEADLPLANYDTLTVASLRARLRTLTVPQLEILISYERAHLGREDVIGMFERRVAKVVSGETTSFQAIS